MEIPFTIHSCRGWGKTSDRAWVSRRNCCLSLLCILIRYVCKRKFFNILISVLLTGEMVAIWLLWTHIAVLVGVAFCNSGLNVFVEAEEEKDSCVHINLLYWVEIKVTVKLKNDHKCDLVFRASSIVLVC